MSILKRFRLELEDRLRYQPLLRRWLARGKLLLDLLRPVRSDRERVRSIDRLCAAARLASSQRAQLKIENKIHRRLELLHPDKVDWSEFVADIANAHISRGVVLKPYLGQREKGVVFISFEKEWFKLLPNCDLKEFAGRYTLVVSPSWDPHSVLNYVFPTRWPDKIFTLISNEADRTVLPRIAPNYVVVPLYASSWVNPEAFAPPPIHEREFDLIMVAAFVKFKRHFALFRALRSMPPQLRVLLVGQEDGWTADDIRAQARWYGVEDRITIRRNQSHAEVARAFRQAKASVILSRREGSCVVVAESMFADTPVAVLENAELGSRAFINPMTGRFVRDRYLAADLTDFISHAADYRPRPWAVENISCFKSTQTLNALLREHARADGQEWTRDIMPLCWQPDPWLVRAEDRAAMLAQRRFIRDRFGMHLGQDDLERSACRLAPSVLAAREPDSQLATHHALDRVSVT